MRTNTPALWATFLPALWSPSAALAADVYFSIPVRELTLVGAVFPDHDAGAEGEPWSNPWASDARVWLDGPGEAYLTPNASQPDEPDARTRTLHLRVPELAAVHGVLILPHPDGQAMTRLPFTIPADHTGVNGRESFFAAQRDHYSHLVERNFPGTAYFRSRAGAAAEELGQASLP